MSATTPAQQAFLDSTEAMAQADWPRSESLLRQALALNPKLAEAHANLAWLLERQHQESQALAHYQRASELQPDNARIQLNHGALLARLRQAVEAEAAYRRALRLAPLLPGAWSNYGLLLALTGRDAQAESCLRQALALDPAHAGAQFNLGCLLLRQGRFTEGWQRLEARDWYAPVAARLDCPRWHGEALHGRRVLMVYEAGHGDLIQFCRYVPLLRELGASRVDLVCHPALRRLLLSLQGVGEVYAYDQDWPRSGWDCWSPALSLPGLCGTNSVEAIPAQLPYLFAQPELQAPWQQRLDRHCPRPGLRVGLVWRGSTAFENDAERSLHSLAVLAPLWQVPGLHFISLQKGAGEDEARQPPVDQPLLNAAEHLHDFADTAALIGALDLVIAVDTAVAHLAGALGKPCWVLLPNYMVDWRWLEQRADSPWYPGVMRLFRRLPGQAWPIGELQRALQQRSGALTSI